MLLNDKQGIRFEDVASWIRRARKDYNAFKLLRGSDTPLSVYMLQQSVEKTIKAISIASGQFSSSEFKRTYKHKSAKLLLELWGKLKKETDSKQESGTVLPSIIQLDDGSPVEVQNLLNFLKELHDRALSIIKMANIQKGDTITFHIIARNFLPQLSYIEPSQLPVSKEKHLDGLTYAWGLEFTDFSERAEDKSATSKNKDFYIRHFKGNWSLFTLFILGCILSTHEARARYPDPNGKGCENYTDALGLIKHINQIGDIYNMTLSYVDNVFEIVSELSNNTKRKTLLLRDDNPSE